MMHINDVNQTVRRLAAERQILRARAAIAHLRESLNSFERSLEAGRNPSGEARNMGQHVADLAGCEEVLNALSSFSFEGPK